MTTELPSHRADEHWFWQQLLENCLLRPRGKVSPRDLINLPGFPIHHKRAWAMLDKWSLRRIYEYGVTSDLGLVTAEGEQVAANPEKVAEFVAGLALADA